MSCPPLVSYESLPVLTQDFSNLREALEVGRASSNVALPSLPGSPMDLELAEVEAKGEETPRECFSWTAPRAEGCNRAKQPATKSHPAMS